MLESQHRLTCTNGIHNTRNAACLKQSWIQFRSSALRFQNLTSKLNSRKVGECAPEGVRNWSRIRSLFHGPAFTDKLTVLQLVKKSPSFPPTRTSFRTVFSPARHLSLSSVKSSQQLPFHFFKIHYCPIIYGYVVWVVSFFRHFSSPPHGPHAIILNSITLIVFCDDCKPRSFSLCAFLNPNLTYCTSGVAFSNYLILCSPVR
jgi:hypothetical protein